MRHSYFDFHVLNFSDLSILSREINSMGIYSPSQCSKIKEMFIGQVAKYFQSKDGIYPVKYLKKSQQ